MPAFTLLRDGLLAAAVIGWPALAVACALDARRRVGGRTATIAAGAVAFVVPYLGAALYAAARPRETLDDRRHRRTAERYLTELTGSTPPNPPAGPATAPAALLVEQPA